MSRYRDEIKHFSKLEHVWWGAKTIAGQRRYDNRFRIFREMCKPGKGTKILEIGCGDGEFTKRLATLPCSITATDITGKLIRNARGNFDKRNIKNVKFLVANAEDLPFPDESFSLICGISILHHLNYKKALKEAFRLVKKDGQIFFSEPNLINPQVYLERHVGLLRKRAEISPGETALTRWGLEKILAKIGFRKVIVKNYDFLHPNTPPQLIKLVENISDILEKIPIAKEVSGSLLVWAQK